MDSRQILFPLLAMVALTFIVAVVMFRRRVDAMKAGRIHPQKVALSAQMSALISDTRASDNLRNLFEMPVLFYAALLTIHAAKLGSVAYLLLVWLYVGTRCLHSYIHCGPNRVMPRFYVYATSCMVLLVIWLLIAFDLIISGRG